MQHNLSGLHLEMSPYQLEEAKHNVNDSYKDSPHVNGILLKVSNKTLSLRRIHSG